MVIISFSRWGRQAWRPKKKYIFYFFLKIETYPITFQYK